jgi:hypothetical protein
MQVIKRHGDPDNRTIVVRDAKLNKTPEELEREMATRRKYNPEPASIQPTPSAFQKSGHGIPENTQTPETMTPATIETVEIQEENLQIPAENTPAQEDENMKVMNLAAQKIVFRIMSKSSTYNEDALFKDLLEVMKNITAQDVVKNLVAHLGCPLPNKSGWKYCEGQVMGKTEYCHGGNFTKCPAFQGYVAHQTVAQSLRKKEAKKEIGSNIL